MMGTIQHITCNGEFQRVPVPEGAPGSKETLEGWVRDGMVQWRRDPDGKQWLSANGYKPEAARRSRTLELWAKALARKLGAPVRDRTDTQCQIGPVHLTSLPGALRLIMPIQPFELPSDVRGYWQRSFNTSFWLAALHAGEVSAFLPHIDPGDSDVAAVLSALEYAHDEAGALLSCLRAHPAVLDRWIAGVRFNLEPGEGR